MYRVLKTLGRSPAFRRWGAMLAVIALLSACGKSEQTPRPAVAIGVDDVCYLCGMTISQYPGPRGEAYLRDDPRIYKFGSTSDLFTWALQPDIKNRITTIYVQDMGATGWEHPQGHFIDARRAWYVVGSSRDGAMGPTLASFARQGDAADFARRYGGRIINYKEITLKIVTHLPAGKQDGHDPAGPGR